MKILLVNAVNGILSTGRFCTELSEYLNKNDHVCQVAYSTGIKTKDSIRISTTIECKIHALMSRITGKQAHFSKCATKKIIRYLKPEQSQR